MKRTLSIILTALMLVTMLTTFSFAEEKPLTGGYDEEYGTITWEYDVETETLTISGTGEYRHTDEMVWFPKKIVVEEGITSVSHDAFSAIIDEPPFTGVGEWVDGPGTNLEELVLPDSLESIGLVFSGYNIIKNIHIPKNVSYISDSNFGYWHFDTTVDPENAHFKMVDGVLYSYDMTKLMRFFDREATEYTIPEGVKEIGESAFYRTPKLTKVTFPSSLEIIREYAFYGCGLTEVVLNEGIKEIYHDAFGSCNDIVSVNLPDGIEYIGNNVFTSSETSKLNENEDYHNGYIGEYNVHQGNSHPKVKEIYDGTVLITEEAMYVYYVFSEEIIIPASVRTICGDYSVEYLERLANENKYYMHPKITFLGTWKEWDALGFPAKDVSCVTPDYKYTDVEADKWYTSAVDYCYELGYLKGMSETQFGVDTDITRGMFITVLARMAGVDTNANDVETKFADVAKNRYYTNAIKWANENGVVAGMSETEFAPDAPIERQQLCVMLVNYAKLMEKEIAAYEDKISFEDSGDIFDYAKTAVEVCQRADIINGYDENDKMYFKPTATAKRTEAAQILFKFAYQFMN